VTPTQESGPVLYIRYAGQNRRKFLFWLTYSCWPSFSPLRSLLVVSSARMLTVDELNTELSSLRAKFKKSSPKTREYAPHSSKVHSVAWSCNGRRLASGSFDKTVCVHAMASSSDKLDKEATYKGHTDSVDQLCWHARTPSC